jgi:TPR repeat protein
MLGDCHAFGVMGTVDPVRARAAYAKAAAVGGGDEKFKLGRFLLSDPKLADKTSAIEWLRRAEKAGSKLAIVQLGLCYESGIGLARSEAEAVRCYLRAADGCLPAKYHLARCYLSGIGVRKDLTKAISILQSAADAGEPFACLLLAQCLQVGYGIAHDPARADKLAAMAIRVMQRQYLGLRPDHLLARAHCCREGLGTPVDVERAKQLTKRAKERGWDKTMAPTVKVSRRGEVTARFERKIRRSPAKSESDT